MIKNSPFRYFKISPKVIRLVLSDKLDSFVGNAQQGGLDQKSPPLPLCVRARTPIVLGQTYASRRLNWSSRVSCQNEGLLLFWVFRQLYVGSTSYRRKLFQKRYILSRIAAIRAHLLVHICMVAFALVLENAGCALVLTRFARQASLVHYQISYDAGRCTNGNNGRRADLRCTLHGGPHCG